ncbi:NAD-binding protein [Patescibacteria group bacterium]|nr:NAD-binding protein [Patescibacteria group bacterium]
MKIIIVGGSATGLALANILGENHEVTLIELDEDESKMVAEKTHSLVLHGDGADISLLKEAGLENADALVTTADDKTNLMVCQIGKSEGVPKIISIVKAPKNEELFTKLGITDLVSNVGTNVAGVKNLLYQVGEGRIIAQFGAGNLQIVEINVPEKSAVVGQKAEFKGAVVSAIYRSGDYVVPQNGVEIEANDVLIITAKSENIPDITSLITSE